MRPAIAITLALLASTLIGASARSEDTVVQVMPDAVKWRVFPLADGVQVSALYGGANKEGIYTLRVKMAPDARLKIHTHPDTRMITVLSGKLYAGAAPNSTPPTRPLFRPAGSSRSRPVSRTTRGRGTAR